MELGKKIKTLRENKSLSQTELAKKVELHPSQLSNLENENIPPFQDFTKYSLLAEVLSTDAQELWQIGQKDRREWKAKEHIRKAKILKPSESQDFRRIPILNSISAGKLIGFTDMEYPVGWADDWEYCPPEIIDLQVYGLDVEGDSMEPKISAGDRVIISHNTDVESGQIAVVADKDDKKVLKRIHYRENQIVLTSDNPKYQPIFWDIKDKPRILGKVVRIIKKP